ncbi:MAG: hypothetical protein ACO1Q7_03070 [Gemmatimonas sp.]
MLSIASKQLSPWIFAAIAITIPSIVVIAVKIGNRRDAQRRIAMGNVAKEMGVPHSASDNSVLQHFGGWAFNQHGSLPWATSVMWMTRDVPMILFDYATRIGSHNNKQIVQRTVMAFDLSASPLPQFFAEGYPPHRFNRFMSRMLGEKSVDFGDLEFAKSFYVSGADNAALRAVFSANTRAFLMRRSAWMCRSTGRWLLLAWSEERPKPEAISAFIDETCELMRLMTGPRSGA